MSRAICPKEESVCAEFIHFLAQVNHFNFDSFQNKTLHWHSLTFAHGRLLCIAADPVNTINGHDQPLSNNWFVGFSNTFKRRTERRPAVRTFLLRTSTLQKYIGSEESINIIRYAQAKRREEPEDFRTNP